MAPVRLVWLVPGWDCALSMLPEPQTPLIARPEPSSRLRPQALQAWSLKGQATESATARNERAHSEKTSGSPHAPGCWARGSPFPRCKHSLKPKPRTGSGSMTSTMECETSRPAASASSYGSFLLHW